MMTGDIESTIASGKGRPKGSREKTKTFPNASISSKSYANVVTSREDNAINSRFVDDSNFVSVGLINVCNDCFFNSTVQPLFSLSSFRDHIKIFDLRTLIL